MTSASLGPLLRPTRVLAVTLWIAVLAPPPAARALDVQLTRIAETCGNLYAPSFLMLGIPSADAGEVAFEWTSGVFKYDGTRFIVVADSGTAVPGGAGNFAFDPSSLGALAIDAGEVFFAGRSSGASDPIGIYRGNGGPVTVVADTNTFVPMGAGTFTGFWSPSAAGGAIGFDGRSAAGEGIYLDTGGGLTRVADTTTIAPGQGTTFALFFRQTSVHLGEIAFNAMFLPGLPGLYRGTAAGLTMRTRPSSTSRSRFCATWPSRTTTGRRSASPSGSRE